MIGGFFQYVDHIHFYVNREEMNLELLFKVSPCLDRENASIRFLIEHVFGPLGGTTAFEEGEGPENSLLFVVELLQGQADVEGAGVQKYMAVVTFSTEVQRMGELGACSSCRQSRGQRHQRRWYRWGRYVWYGQRGRISYELYELL